LQIISIAHENLNTRTHTIGFVLDLPLNSTAALSQIAVMKSSGIIDRATRGVFVDFNLFNPTEGLHTLGRLAFEMPTTGGLLSVPLCQSYYS